MKEKSSIRFSPHFRANRTFLTFLLVSLFLNLLALFFFFKNFISIPRHAFWGTAFWLLSLLSLGIFLLTRSESKTKRGRQLNLTKKEKIALFFIVIFSIGLRIYKIDHLGVFLDDWYWLDGARKILNGSVFTPFGFIGDQPSNLPAYFVAFFYSIFNKTYLAARITGIFFSTANLLLAFFLAKELFGKRVAFISSILIGVSIWDIYVSKIPWINTTINPALTTGSLLFLFRSLKYFSPKDIFWAGIFIGASINLLYLAAVHILALAILALIKFLRSKNKPKLLTTFVFVSYVTFLVASPTFPKIKNYPHMALARHKSFAGKNIAASQGQETSYYIEQLKLTAEKFKSSPDNYQRHTYPYWGITIERFIQYLFIIGFLYLLVNIRKEKAYFLLLSFSVMFIPLVFFERGVSEWREYGFFSHIYIFSSVGLVAIFIVFNKIFRIQEGTQKALLSIFLILYGVSWAYNFKSFYGHNIAVNPFQYEKQCKEISEYILKNVNTRTIILLPNEVCKELVAVRIWNKYAYAGYTGLSDLDKYLMVKTKEIAIIKPAIHYPLSNHVLGEFELDKYLSYLNYLKYKIPSNNSSIYLVSE